jgi:hypothetical protein
MRSLFCHRSQVIDTLSQSRTSSEALLKGTSRKEEITHAHTCAHAYACTYTGTCIQKHCTLCCLNQGTAFLSRCHAKRLKGHAMLHTLTHTHTHTHVPALLLWHLAGGPGVWSALQGSCLPYPQAYAQTARACLWLDLCALVCAVCVCVCV